MIFSSRVIIFQSDPEPWASGARVNYPMCADIEPRDPYIENNSCLIEYNERMNGGIHKNRQDETLPR